MNSLLIKLIGPFLLTLILPLSTTASTYYLSSRGNDTLSGRSPAQAWRTISKVNSTLFGPGDTILFEGGATFDGNLYFHQGNVQVNGAKLPPLRISSYGTGKAEIKADTSYGFYAHNVGGFELSNLLFTGSGYETNKDHGILFYNTLPANVKLAHIYIDSVEVQGFRKSGITIGGYNGNSGYQDVQITSSIVHDIGSEGITSWGAFDQKKEGYAHEDIYVGNNHVYNVFGLPVEKHSGSGIVLSDVNEAVIEYNVVHHSGMNNIHCGGPVGIWAWDANRVVIQFNEAYNISAGSGCDGGGFDLDGGTTNSVMQYNYSHDNDGAGFLIAQFEGARPMHDNTVRYNISENDGRKNQYKGISLWVAPLNSNGGNKGLLVHNNTVYADKEEVPTGGGLRIMSGDHHDTRFYNNIFYTANGAVLIDAADTTNQLEFRNNNFYSEASPPLFVWSDSVIADAAAFNQLVSFLPEHDPTGLLQVEPGLVRPGAGDTIGYPLDLSKLKAYRLKAQSPLIDKGLNLHQQLQVSPGLYDLFLNILPQTYDLDIGAYEYPKSNKAVEN